MSPLRATLTAAALAMFTLAGSANARTPDSAPSNVGKNLHPHHCVPRDYYVDRGDYRYWYHIDFNCQRTFIGQNILIH